MLGNSKQAKMELEQLYCSFGRKEDDPNESLHFLGRIRGLLRDSLEGLLMVAEMFYKHKGQRSITRPELIQDTFEESAAAILQHLRSYQKQCDDFHNKSLRDFRVKLSHCEKLTAQIPELIFQDIFHESAKNLERKRIKAVENFQQNLDLLEARRKEYESQLHARLGHPELRAQFEVLRSQEEGRAKKFKEVCNEFEQQIDQLMRASVGEFLNATRQAHVNLLKQFDEMLTVDDVESGVIVTKKMPLEELIGRSIRSMTLEDDEAQQSSFIIADRSPKRWPLVPVNIHSTFPIESEIREKPASKIAEETVLSCKTTLAHVEIDSSVHNSVEAFKNHYDNVTTSSSKHLSNVRAAENRATQAWQLNVSSISNLFSDS